METATETKVEQLDYATATGVDTINSAAESLHKPTKSKSRNANKTADNAAKRRCVSTACIACRKRKSKCDGNTPSCAACSSVYGTECIYDPNSDHRRKGVYKKDIDNLKTRNSTLQTLIQAILNFPEHEVPDLVKQIRTCESLDDVAESIIARDSHLADDDEDAEAFSTEFGTPSGIPQFEKELSGKMGKLRLDNGSVSIIGGTSNLIFIGSSTDGDDSAISTDEEPYILQKEPATSWTEVTDDPRVVMHLMTMYFTWHYTYFTTLSKSLFWNEFKAGRPARDSKRKTEYCTPLLVNAMLALGCHFTSWPEARAVCDDSATAGDHFFKEAKRLILENDEHENPRLTTVQALSLMSVREAGCGREARGWVYSGMSFRMAYDLGLNVDSGSSNLDDEEIDARKITIWGCFLFDKCWSNYLGRQPQLPLSSISVPKFDVFPMEDAEIWRPYLDSGTGQAHSQPSRTRAIALQISHLCEISSDLLLYFYHPHQLEKPSGKQAELKKLSELHTRLEAWRKNLPKEMEPREGQLPNVLVMQMFFQLLFIHLFRPFLKYKQTNSPLPAHVSPRKFLTHAAAAISKLLRLYRRTYGLRQICNIVVYIAHSACTVHLLNLPDKNAARDIVHGLNHLEEIAECWLGARRTIGILHLVAKRWNLELPEAAAKTFIRADVKFGPSKIADHESHHRAEDDVSTPTPSLIMSHSPAKVHNSDLRSTTVFPTTSYYAPTNTTPQSAPQSNIASRSSQSPSNYPLRFSPPSQPVSTYSASPNQQQYMIPPNTQQDLWSANPQNTLGRATVPSPAQPSRSVAPIPTTGSPTAMFGGVQPLIQDQEWLFRDSHQIFANWNGMDHHDSSGVWSGGGGDFGAGAVTNGGGDMGGSNLGFGNVHHGHGNQGLGGYGNGVMQGLDSYGNMNGQL